MTPEQRAMINEALAQYGASLTDDNRIAYAYRIDVGFNSQWELPYRN